MNLPRPPDGLDKDLLRFLIELLKEIENADRQNRKTTGDVEISTGQRLILLGDDSLKYRLAIVAADTDVSPL